MQGGVELAVAARVEPVAMLGAMEASKGAVAV